METVVCYDADTGREVWNRQVEARFDDPLGGPGPRATPTLAKEGMFVTGATGIFLCLNPATGEIVWQQDLKKVAGREAPGWGFSASPLVAGSVVIVHAGGSGDKGLLAFDVASGTLRWSAAAGNDSYSSPQLNSIAGEELVLMLSNEGLLLVDPATGKTRLNYEWKFMNYRALQPHVVGEDTILLPTGMNTGTRAIRITKADGKLAANELWTSRNLKPDFTDFVSQATSMASTAGSSPAWISRPASVNGKADATARARCYCWRLQVCCWCQRKTVEWCCCGPIRARRPKWLPSRHWKERLGTIRWSSAKGFTSAIPRKPSLIN